MNEKRNHRPAIAEAEVGTSRAPPCVGPVGEPDGALGDTLDPEVRSAFGASVEELETVYRELAK